MEAVDVYGINPVCSLIEQTGLSKFIIHRLGSFRQGNANAVFEYIKGNSNKNAYDSFKQWANNILSGGGNNLAYEITLFDKDGNDEQLPGTKKEKRIRFSFSLMKEESFNPHQNYQPRQPDQQSQSEAIKLAVEMAMQSRDNSDLRKEMDALKLELKAFKEDEDEDEGLGESEDSNLLDKLKDILVLSGLAKKEENLSPQLAGPEPTKTEIPKRKLSQTQIDNCNRALTILFKNDENIDTDLLKLATISENQKTTFNFLIEKLRSM